jgi:OmpA-OmpF porin, OOP family
MGIKKFLLASAAIAVLASPATALDRSGWYVGLGAGWSMVDDIDAPAATFEGGYGVYGSVGYALPGNWRIEGELGYRVNDGDMVRPAVVAVIRDETTLTETTLMANVAYDIPLSTGMALSVLGGVGVDRADLELPGGDDRDYVFAWQAGAELTFQTSTHWDWYVGYRYLDTETVSYNRTELGLAAGPAIEHEYNKHMVSVGLRYGYDAPAAPVVVAPPPPPPPPAIKQFIVFFGFNKYNLTADAQAVVAEAASAAKSQGAASIIVVGHTDTVGGNAYNQKLSEKRAGAVKDELVRLGIDSGKISASGKGETELLVQTGEGVKEPQNRRATIDLK